MRRGNIFCIVITCNESLSTFEAGPDAINFALYAESILEVRSLEAVGRRGSLRRTA
jgi:hypothetical protein